LTWINTAEIRASKLDALAQEMFRTNAERVPAGLVEDDGNSK
jgi:hypothetical protein